MLNIIIGNLFLHRTGRKVVVTVLIKLIVEIKKKMERF